jgi:hypothetical protein
LTADHYPANIRTPSRSTNYASFRAPMSCTGSAAAMVRSAFLPGSRYPRTPPRPSSSAAAEVLNLRAWAGRRAGLDHQTQLFGQRSERVEREHDPRPFEREILPQEHYPEKTPTKVIRYRELPTRSAPRSPPSA